MAALDMLVVLGPTASGKTELACSVAAELDAEIISADSRQVYRKMDIGTGKDLKEYTVDDKAIPYHLIDIKDPGYHYNIGEYQLDFLNCFSDIQNRNRLPILCGGSGMYLETALRGNSYLGIPENPELRADLEDSRQTELAKLYLTISGKIKKVIPADTVRRMIRAIEIDHFISKNSDFQPRTIPSIDSCIVGVDIDREERRDKITKRLKVRLASGLIEEVEELLKSDLNQTDLDYYGLEYKWVGNYLAGAINRDELFEKLNIAIHQFSKRQMTWFRRMEKNGYQINWIKASDSISSKKDQVLELLK